MKYLPVKEGDRGFVKLTYNPGIHNMGNGELMIVIKAHRLDVQSTGPRSIVAFQKDTAYWKEGEGFPGLSLVETEWNQHEDLLIKPETLHGYQRQLSFLVGFQSSMLSLNIANFGTDKCMAQCMILVIEPYIRHLIKLYVSGHEQEKFFDFIIQEACEIRESLKHQYDSILKLYVAGIRLGVSKKSSLAQNGSGSYCPSCYGN